MTRILFLFFFSSLCAKALMGQAVILAEVQKNDKQLTKLWEKTLDAFKDGQLEKSRKTLDDIIEKEPAFVDAYLLSGDVYARSGDIDNSVAHYRKALDLAPDYKIAGWYSLSKVFERNDRYEESIEALEEYIKRVNGEKKGLAQKELKRLKFTAEARANPVEFNPYNLGPNINSIEPEYFPSFSLDGKTLVFTRRLNERNEDFYISSKTEDGWTKAVPLPEVNTSLNEGAQHLSADGSTLLFTACNRPEGLGSCDIWIATKTADGWSTGVMINGALNSKDWDSQPCMTPDGNTIYFASNRTGGKGGMDIWSSTKQKNGAWGTAENLGKAINSKGQEQSPFIHPDGATLYFTSSGHQGLGETDLFLSRRGLDGNWETPINMGWPLNTKANEGGLVVSLDGMTAFYSSDREDSQGKLDLYAFTLPEDLRPTPVTYVKATVVDAVTGKPLMADVSLFNLKNETLLTQAYSNEKDGSFLVCLPSGNQYMLKVAKENYLFHSSHFELAKGQAAAQYEIEIRLAPVKTGAEVTLKNVFFETASASLSPASIFELKTLLNLLITYPALNIQLNGHTDSEGELAYNLDLSTRRAKAVYQYLIDNGIPESRLAFKGYGESKPIDSNDTETGRKNNRRTTFEVTSIN